MLVIIIWYLKLKFRFFGKLVLTNKTITYNLSTTLKNYTQKIFDATLKFYFKESSDTLQNLLYINTQLIY